MALLKFEKLEEDLAILDEHHDSLGDEPARSSVTTSNAALFSTTATGGFGGSAPLRGDPTRMPHPETAATRTSWRASRPSQ